MSALRLAPRRLRTTPAFTVTAVLTLALGIGMNGLVFSVIKAMLLNPLPFPHAERLVWVYGQNPARGVFGDRVSAEEAAALARRATVFDAVAVIGDWALVRSDGGRLAEWIGLRVSPSLATVLGVTPSLGRAFSTDDLHATHPGQGVMMLSHERWQRDFGGDPSVLGKALRFDAETTYTIVGILPPGLEFPLGRSPQSGNGSGFIAGVQDFWVLGQSASQSSPGGTMVARLRPGTTMARAATEIEAVSLDVGREFPRTHAGRSLTLVPLREQLLGVMRPALPLLQGFAGFVLLIACGNLANLMFARATHRRTEFAVRAALGAGSSDLLRMLLAESLLLSGGGTVLGLLLARVGRDLLVTLTAGQVPLIERASLLDGTVLLFTLLLCVATTLGCGLWPALRAVRGASAASAMVGQGARGQTVSRDQARVRRTLIVSQMALTLVLLVGAALVRQSLSRLMAVDAGYQAGRVITADVLLASGDARAFFRALHERLRGLPGVEAVGLIQSTPLTGKWTFREPLSIVGQPQSPGRVFEVPGRVPNVNCTRAFGPFGSFNGSASALLARSRW